MTTVAAAREDSSTDEAQPPDSQTSNADSAPDSRTAAEQKTDDSTESAATEAAAALPQVLKIVGTVVAPTTLLTALMFYFGRQWATGFFRYFGVQPTVLDLTIQDYLIRSVDGLIIPLIIVVGAALVALWIHRLQLEALPAGARRIMLGVLMPSAALAGLVLVTLALADVSKPVFPETYPEARGLSFSIGVLLLAYAVRLLRLFTSQRRPAQPLRAPGAVVVAEWGALFILVSVGLFWAVGDYANLVGTGRAQQIEATLPGSADVVAYSEKRLSLQAPGVREVTCQDPDAAYRFRYEGLKLVLQSGNQYLFLPAGWTHANGTTIVLPRSEALRLEFSPAGQAQNATC
jgi:hypothetical protein